MRGKRDGVRRRHVLKGGAGIATAGVVGLAGCTGDDDGDVSMTIASTFEPGHINVEAAEMFEEEIEEESDGEIEVEVSAGGAYGAEDEIGELVADGEPEAHAAGTVPFLQYASEYWFFGNPFVLEDYDHLLRVMDDEIMDGAEETMIENGNQRPIGQQIYRGLRQFTANEPIETPEDLQGLSLRLPELDPWVDIWSQIGASPTPVALDELYSALQTGTVDSSEGDAEQIHSFNLQEVQTHLSLTEHLVETGNLYMNEDFLQGLDESHQDLVLEIGQSVTEEASEQAQDREEELIDELEEEGMTVVDDVDQDAFDEAAEPVVDQWFEAEWVGTWDEVQDI
jgi:TRAP-type transport system periplasmic protein